MERWAPLLVDADWHAFCQALCEGIEGDHWRELYDACKEMIRAVGVKKATRGPESKSPLENECSQGCGCDPVREDDILVRNKTRLALWEEHLEDPIVALDKALKCVENSCWEVVARELSGGVFCNGQLWFPPKFVGKIDMGERYFSVQNQF